LWNGFSFNSSFYAESASSSQYVLFLHFGYHFGSNPVLRNRNLHFGSNPHLGEFRSSNSRVSPYSALTPDLRGTTSIVHLLRDASKIVINRLIRCLSRLARHYNAVLILRPALMPVRPTTRARFRAVASSATRRRHNRPGRSRCRIIARTTARNQARGGIPRALRATSDICGQPQSQYTAELRLCTTSLSNIPLIPPTPSFRFPGRSRRTASATAPGPNSTRWR